MFAERDFAPGPMPVTTADLVADLELATLWDGMARGDDTVRAVVRAAMLDPLTDPADLRHRQQVLADCLDNSATVRALYELANAAVEVERKLHRTVFTGRPEPLLNRAVRVLEEFDGLLRRLRDLTARHAGQFRSAGFTTMFRTVLAELDDDYFHAVAELLEQLRFDHGIVVTARLGPGNRGAGFVLREPPDKGDRVLRKSRLTVVVTGEDEHDHRALVDLRGRALDDVANAAAQSADHLRDFFTGLRDELAFYLGGVNLAETLATVGMPTCWPEPRAVSEQAMAASDLYEPCLALRQGRRVIGSDVAVDGRGVVVLTGPNQGGKSTFLRSVGVAHVMMQAGMFVAAHRFAASLVNGVFTHYKRDEDATMTSGKLDEELARMSVIADHVTPGSLVLFNESFASTNEQEGSDIAGEIVRALADAGIRVVFVTHLYELARRLYTEDSPRCLFLRATRRDDGERTFQITPGEPSPTAHGADLYAKIVHSGR
ncbi:MutS-like protein [Actinocrispum wychmicini]|uniref:MutS-like protein n=2 Tax=Actinocrispum wychmicini TaxID=1213861 RepID=A0A4R2JLM2_9PSEU|nr:MutS-like protein [Actinocrispum wychmicini]